MVHSGRVHTDKYIVHTSVIKLIRVLHINTKNTITNRGVFFLSRSTDY